MFKKTKQNKKKTWSALINSLSSPVNKASGEVKVIQRWPVPERCEGNLFDNGLILALWDVESRNYPAQGRGIKIILFVEQK